MKTSWLRKTGAALLLLCGVTVFSFAKQTKIRVGLIEYPGFCYKDDYGIYRGIDVEMVYKVAQKAGYTVEIYGAPYSASSAFELLEKGKIDVMGDMIKTDERQSRFIFSDLEQGHNYNSVYVSKASDQFQYGDVSQLAKMTFGCEKSVAAKEMFIAWGKLHGFTPMIHEYDSYEQVNKAIENKEIDAGIIGADSVEGFRIIQKYISTPYYFMFSRNNLELKNQFDTAMEQIFQNDPLYTQKLYTKYTTDANREIESFTNEEKQYIATHPSVKVAVWKNNAPFFQNVHGKIEGIIPEYYAQLSKVTGITFTFVECNSQHDAVRSVHNGQSDVLSLDADDIITAALNDLSITEVYTVLTAAEISKSGTENISSIAIARRNEQKIKKSLSVENKDLQIVTVEDAASCFKKMQRGEVDAAICTLPAAVWLVNQHNVSEYKIATLASLNWNICGAVRKEDSALCSILDKAIAVSEQKMQGIISANTMQERTFLSYVERIPKGALALIVVILIIVVIIMIVTAYLLYKHHLEITAVERVRQENARKESELAAIEKSTEEKNLFFANISHDMRTPLNAVIGFSELAMKEPVNEQTNSYLQKIQSSGNLLLELINDTLTISKISSGKLKLSPSAVYSEKLFDSIIIPIREVAKKKGVSFTSDFSELKKKVIFVDELNLQKVFLNLLSNAVKYTPSGGTVQFAYHFDSASQRESCFTIQDDGIGMAQEFIPHMYEPFAQEQRHTKSGAMPSGIETSGTGLGLSIVKRLVDLMDGTISVESRINKGTTFTIRLHLEEVKEQATAEEPHVPVAEYVDLSGKKILVCEDNMMNREIIQSILEGWKMDVVSAEDGQQGVDIFAASKPGEIAAVLMDLRMPRMNGFEATRAIRALNRSDAILVPVVALTADAFDDDIRKCYECGMNAHLAKPVDQQKVYDLLCQLLK